MCSVSSSGYTPKVNQPLVVAGERRAGAVYEGNRDNSPGNWVVWVIGDLTLGFTRFVSGLLFEGCVHGSEGLEPRSFRVEYHTALKALRTRIRGFPEVFR